MITRINRVPVTTLADFQRVIDSLKPGDPVVLNLSRYDRRGDAPGSFSELFSLLISKRQTEDQRSEIRGRVSELADL